MEPNPAVEVHALRHCYGDRVALQDIDFTVNAGEIFGLLGPNGGGKSTTFKILSTLLRPTGGTAKIFGTDVTLQPAERVEKLSGGLQRRVELAKGMLHRPRLLLLDEPSTGLDPVARRDLWRQLERLRKESGVTVLLTTHIMEEADDCDRVAILDNGKVIALGTPHELIMGLGAEHIVEFSLEKNCEVSAEMDWTDLPAVTGASIEVGRHLLSVSQPHVVIPALINRIEQRGWKLASLTTRHASLDDVFVSLTGRHVEESEEDSDD
ncbi:MAG: ABC transporter ATP-binding protein [Planctomycetes bacterium]|nr:ABC transporter ATP-binding protein [Planctomycetota bacterium]